MIVVWLGALLFWALRWLMGLTLVAGFLLFTGANACLVVHRLVRNKGFIAIPLIGGVAGALSCFVLPSSFTAIEPLSMQFRIEKVKGLDILADPCHTLCG